MSIIIADSGSTKTTWALIGDDKADPEIILTQGINPYYQDSDEILGMLEKEFPGRPGGVEEIHFYGAGCANETVNAIVFNALERYFGVSTVEVQSDLMAAARALCGREPGIAAILGTGSNSCYYDGERITAHVSPLGFILGDEGSGAVMGRSFLADLLKNQLPQKVADNFFETSGFTAADIMNHIYKLPFPNRFAARFTRFMYEHRDEPAISTIITSQFSLFIERNLFQYRELRTLPLSFCGSIAWYFVDLLSETLARYELAPQKILRDPMEGLIGFHRKIG